MNKLRIKMFYSLIIFIVAAFGFSAAEKIPLPPITICKRNSINYSDCLKDAIQESWPLFLKGLPELNFPPLEPLNYDFGNIVVNRGFINGVGNVSNFMIKSLSEIRFLATRSHFVDKVFHLEIDIQMPNITGSGKLSAVGTLGGFTVIGIGNLIVTLEDITGLWIIKGHVANDTWTIEDFYAAPSIQKMKIYFDLFKDKEFNNFVVNFANEYWPIIYRIVLPVAINTYNPWLCNLANHFFSKVSFTEIFP